MNSATQKLYDRSIRTWGLEAQQRILTSKVLVIGYNCIMSEILKNIVISGVSDVTIVDEFKGKAITTSECDSNHIFYPQPNTLV